ncbi:MAG: hypothetical protein GY713_19200 [Actinomycetia bacterium]|nr:hypothetical protein [Actinomycetes bacterium]
MRSRLALCIQILVVIAIAASCSSTTSPEVAPPSSRVETGTVPTTTTTPTEEATTSAYPAPPFLCAASGESDTTTNVDDPELDEISGLAAGRANPTLVWAVDDDASPPSVHGLGPDGSTVARVDLTGVTGRDWEDLAVGPGPDGEQQPYLHVADIGDNAAERDQIRVLRFPEPVELGTTAVAPDIITLVYPDGPRDAESLAVDPLTGDLILVSKERTLGPLGVYRAPSPPVGDTTITMEWVGELDAISLRSAQPLPLDMGAIAWGGFLPTALDVSSDGLVVALRTYEAVWLFARQPDQPLWIAFDSEPCEAAAAIEEQGEALALTPTGYVTISEGANPAMNLFEFSSD